MKENWKDVIGYEGLYEVSNLGRVRRTYPKLRYLSLKTIHNGYISVGLCKNAKVKTIKIHRLVGLAFIPNPDNKPTINHKDGNKLNNNLNNLEWATWKENLNHADLNKLRDINGSKNKSSKIAEKDIEIIRNIYKTGQYSYQYIGDLFNVTKQTIRFIIIGRTWKNI